MKNLTLLAATLFGLSLAQGAGAATAEEVIAANKCTKCHTATTTKKAPSYAAVATKWAGKPEAATVLFKGLKAGGKMGEEEEHKKAEATDDEIKAVVAFVLSSK
jgi:cytochrome c551/c552